MLFPFSAIVGQRRMKRALIFNAVDPSIGGVLISGTRGTAKSTAARALAGLLPPIDVAEGDPFQREPAGDDAVAQIPTPFVNLPLGSTEDRLLGTLDIQRALQHGEKHFEPGLLAAAHRGVLYVDEVNLLPDHLVDVLLDAIAMGVNRIEREGVSFEHPARVILVGTMNPEEGELRPQLLDRFGLFVQADSYLDLAERKEVVRRRMRFDDTPSEIVAEWASSDKQLAASIVRARSSLLTVAMPEGRFDQIAELAAEARVDGLRADVVMVKTARAAAAFEGSDEVTAAHVEEAAELTLGHRRRSQAEPPPGRAPQPPPAPQPPRRSSLTDRQEEGREQGDSSRNLAGARESHFDVGSPLETRLPSLPARRGPNQGSPQGRRTGPLACRPSGAFVRAVEPRPGDSLTIAPMATLRAAALEGVPLAPRHLRIKQRRSRRRNLLLFVVDASGSMAASERMRAAKGGRVRSARRGVSEARRGRLGRVPRRGRRRASLAHAQCRPGIPLSERVADRRPDAARGRTRQGASDRRATPEPGGGADALPGRRHRRPGDVASRRGLGRGARTSRSHRPQEYRGAVHRYRVRPGAARPNCRAGARHGRNVLPHLRPASQGVEARHP